MSSHVPDSHPRAKSLRLRERLAEGLAAGLTSPTGLIAHGRGEAFYYLLGERTHPFAADAIAAASAMLRTARHPVFSVNGNVAGLAAQEVVDLLRDNPELRVEVNLFHYSEDRVKRIVDRLEGLGAANVLGLGEWEPLAGLESPRRRMATDGIARADVVFVPLEDGDRCEALVASGRKVIAVDLNPLSRTARMATVTVVDELTQVLPLLAARLRADRGVAREELLRRLANYDNAAVLDRAAAAIRGGA